MKQIEVQIMGQSYLLGCPEDGEERLRIAVEKVDSAMCAIRDQGKIRARDRIAVLAALNLAFDLTDRQAAEPSSRQPQPATPDARQAAVFTAQGTAPAGEAEPQLELLLTKLDQALADPAA